MKAALIYSLPYDAIYIMKTNLLHWQITFFISSYMITPNCAWKGNQTNRSRTNKFSRIYTRLWFCASMLAYTSHATSHEMLFRNHWSVVTSWYRGISLGCIHIGCLKRQYHNRNLQLNWRVLHIDWYKLFLRRYPWCVFAPILQDL